ncbi:unnamed protein product [marine sediment metagenome]|uniref:Mechanosensitive ion channel MscS C-terminal domain-containing protein n=1 Tax=marine sediment metagenome TaxID=412755 RepID=X1CUT5_9ZZZZ
MEHVDRIDRVHFTEFGDFSLNFDIVYYIKTKDYAKYRDTQQEINFAGLIISLMISGIFLSFLVDVSYVTPNEKLILRFSFF